jgi:hypothetical protein
MRRHARLLALWKCGSTSGTSALFVAARRVSSTRAGSTDLPESGESQEPLARVRESENSPQGPVYVRRDALLAAKTLEQALRE